MADEDDVPGYSRSKFPYWVTQYGTCDTRSVRATYRLTANPAEAASLSEMLDTCAS
ncbi:hypothetical protein ACFU98_34880 [Streptomyces sp. NPDC057575]|uniref:hypothetical protein n=1 Tax=unclassified Streptomyces TaxID=2593676 RepID=UPI0036A84DE0